MLRCRNRWRRRGRYLPASRHFANNGRPHVPASSSPAQESSMLLNALFPTRDIGTDPVKIRDWAQAAEGLGYHCIEVADHVFGAAARGDWKPVYSELDPFHET